MESLRTDNEKELIARSSVYSENSPHPLGTDHIARSKVGRLLLKLPRTGMWMCGVMPVSCHRAAVCYVNCLPFLAALFAVHAAFLVVREPELTYVHLCTVCHAIGGCVGLISFRVYSIQELLGPHNRPLELYAISHDFFPDWQGLSMYRFISVALLWLFGVLTRALLWGNWIGDSCSETMPLFSLVSFTAVSGLVAVQLYVVLHVCCGLELMVDKFCSGFFTNPDVSQGVSDWNMLQAILRRAAHTIDSCFLALQTSVLATILLTGVEVVRGSGSWLVNTSPKCMVLWAILVLLPVFLVLYTLFRAAAVTEKCSRVPALVNSWFVEGKQIDNERQYIVNYIVHSAAGFYLKGVRLSAFMVLKLSYLFGMLAFTALTQLLIRI